MTEQEWLTSDDPLAMLGHLTRWPTGDESGGRATHPHHPGDRKLRLFACACCRQVPSVMAVDGVSKAVAAAECFADGLSTSKDRGLAINSADLIPGGPLQARSRAYACLRSDATQGAYEAISLIGGDKTASAQAAILRDIAGNPWRPVTLNPAWLTPTVLSLAQAAYDKRPGRECDDAECRGRGKWADAAGDACECGACHGTGRIDDGSLDPVRLAILADALEEAGCDSEDLLAHLRSPGPHVRGCWAVDLVLGKE